MALQSSGQISLGDVRTELGLTGQISLGDTAVRDLFGLSSGQIGISNGYGAASTLFEDFYTVQQESTPFGQIGSGSSFGFFTTGENSFSGRVIMEFNNDGVYLSELQAFLSNDTFQGFSSYSPIVRLNGNTIGSANMSAGPFNTTTAVVVPRTKIVNIQSPSTFEVNIFPPTTNSAPNQGEFRYDSPTPQRNVWLNPIGEIIVVETPVINFLGPGEIETVSGGFGFSIRDTATSETSGLNFNFAFSIVGPD